MHRSDFYSADKEVVNVPVAVKQVLWAAPQNFVTDGEKKIKKSSNAS